MIDASFQFAGKVAFVSGAASGIGRATALAFGAAGATVVLADLDGPTAEQLASAIIAAGGKADAHRADMTDPHCVADLFSAISDTHGRLDIAHNNVGFGFGHGLVDTTLEQWDRTLDLCLKSPFICMQHEIRLMLDGGGGAIVNTASMAGVTYSALASAAYSAAKAGVIHLSAYAAMVHAGDNIRVNAISPGLVNTAAVAGFLDDDQQRQFAAREQPIGRVIRPEEIAANVLWLCSDAAKMITGHNVCVAGGMQV
jgi:NAD(P)-dependent dehydrogenase (short-subunit alcohol dehydrogenase family)